jgi:hypothetical protein
MGSKNESIGISSFHAAMNSGERKCRSGWAVLGGMVTFPVSSCTLAPPSGANDRESRPSDPASTLEGRPSCSGVAPAGEEPSEGPFHRQGAGNPRRERGLTGLSRPGTCFTSKRNVNQRARNRLTPRLVRSHGTLWLSVRSVKSDRTLGGRGFHCPEGSGERPARHGQPPAARGRELDTPALPA